jgi:hypothetical protein
VKTGFRPDPTLLHPAIGSVICHEFESIDSAMIDIRRHISILPGSFPARGGYLGDHYDAFRVFDPMLPVPDMKSNLPPERQLARLEDLNALNADFMRGRQLPSSKAHAFGQPNLASALQMMSSEQLDAFDVSLVPVRDRLRYGDTPFGRGCLAAFRLIQAGVRCVEVALPGWDTHVDNHELQGNQIKILDPAFATLIADLKAADLLDSTLVVCGGEFGRTPWLNPLGGRDHWPHGFSMALAGGGIQGGRVVGQTNPQPKRETKNRREDLVDSHSVQDLHATIYHALGIEYSEELITPIGRPLKICEGQPIDALLET